MERFRETKNLGATVKGEKRMRVEDGGRGVGGGGGGEKKTKKEREREREGGGEGGRQAGRGSEMELHNNTTILTYQQELLYGWW